MFSRNSARNVLFSFKVNEKRSCENYQMDIEIFDEIEGEILTMSDYIAAGIVMQFYYRFQCPYIYYFEFLSYSLKFLHYL